jgi:membrane protein YqaA with SNARE-associated domain
MCYSLLFLVLCVTFSVTSSLVCVILCYLLPSVWNSQWTPLENHTHKRRDNRESHTQERSSLRITHTWQEITENNTHKTRDSRESHTQGLVCVILCYFLPCVCNSQWTPLLCVWFSVIPSLVCVILCYLLSCMCYSLLFLVDHKESHAQGKRSQRIARTREEITENHTHKRGVHWEFHTQGKK